MTIGMNLATALLLGLTLIFLTGCRDSLSREYGTSEGATAKKSPASISLFRGMCEANNHDTQLVRSFSPRAKERLQAIVWTPDQYGPHRAATIAWLDSWLSMGDRTLIYVGRDFSALSEYSRQSIDRLALQESPYPEIYAAMEEKSRFDSELDIMRARCRPKVAMSWCLFDYSESSVERVASLVGPWADGIDASQANIYVRGYPLAYEKQSYQAFRKELEDASIEGTAKTTKPANNDAFEFVSGRWDTEMLQILKGLNAEDLPTMQSLLATSSDQTLIGEITRLQWGTSRVIVLANTSLISNISLTNPANRSVARRLVDELPKQNVGFLTGVMDPPIRTDDDMEQQKGFEMLTVWPLNVITLHAAFLGMLMLVSIFPIFGRAKQLPRKSTREFGQHIDAVGGLLFKSKDRFYAMATIADYFRIVRKEPTSPWANLETKLHQNPKSPFAAPPPPPERAPMQAP